MQHLNEEVVTGHLSTQVLVTQVVLRLDAEQAQLTESQQQLAEFLEVLWIGTQRVL